MKKRLLSLAMALAMCLSLLPAAAFATEGTKEIQEVPLSFQLPVAGAHPQIGRTAGGDGYWVEILSWEDTTDFHHPVVMD